MFGCFECMGREVVVFGRVWTRFALRSLSRCWGPVFFSFRGFRLVHFATLRGRVFLLGFASGFRWCLAVLSAWPGGCCFGRVLGLGGVAFFCPGAGALFSSPLGVSDLSLRHPAGEGFFCWVCVRI